METYPGKNDTCQNDSANSRKPLPDRDTNPLWKHGWPLDGSRCAALLGHSYDFLGRAIGAG